MAANTAGNGRCVLRCCFADATSPAVAEIHFRKDGQCEVNAQFRESLGGPLWNTACARKAKRPLADTTRPVDGTVENVATAKHVKFVAAASAVAGERVKKVAELPGLLECCDVIQRLISHMSPYINMVRAAHVITRHRVRRTRRRCRWKGRHSSVGRADG